MVGVCQVNSFKIYLQTSKENCHKLIHKMYILSCLNYRWSILCLDWHRSVRRLSPEAQAHMLMVNGSNSQNKHQQQPRNNNIDYQAKRSENVTQSNFAHFVAWGLPAFQTAAVIVSDLVDSDELLGK